MRLHLTSLFLFLFSVSLFAQSNIKGIVTDQTGEPLPGVTVAVKGSTNGAITDIEGAYTLDAVKKNSLIVFSFIGFTTQEIETGSKSTINVTLKEDVLNLDEVVVVGYGSTKVKDLTSSITSVKSEELLKTPSGQAMQAIQGKVAGVQVVSSGGPGDAPTIRVRGIGSYPGSNNEAPLYVVDGMFFTSIDFLNPADIETMSVLKDASAAAIYGVRAANGVILIETKSGKKGQPAQIEYNGYYGTQVAQDILKMANAEQYTTMIEESGSAADYTKILNAMQRYGRSRINPNVPDVNTDWYEEVIRPAAIQNHSISIGGSSNDATYSLGGSYFSQEGILDMKNEYERVNFRAKVDYNANEWLTVGGNVIVSDATKYSAESGAWKQAYFAVPILPVLDELNTEAWPVKYSNAKDIGYRGSQNPFPTMRYSDNRIKTKKTLSNFYAKFELIPNKLSFKTTYNHAVTNVDERYVRLPYMVSGEFRRDQIDSSITKKTANYDNKIIDNVITYTDSFDKHNLSVMAGHSYRDEQGSSLSAKGLDFPWQYEKAWYIDQCKEIVSESVGDGGSRYYGISYFGRLSYNFDDKYLVYGTMRADGSSKYQEKWGYFPTIGAGWVLTEEDFLNSNNVFDFLKVRASWGQLGNDKIQASDGAATSELINTAIGGEMVTGTKTSSIYSSLKWEVSEEMNFGFTAKLLSNKLSIEADYYIRDTNNAAIRVKVPSNGGTVLKNVGVIRNSGLELDINWRENISNDLSISAGVNIATLKNEVTDLYGQPYIDGGSAEFRQRSIVGEPLLAFFGYQTDGVYQNQAEIDADPIAVANNLEAGDYRYVNQNGDDVINDDDRRIIGSYFPNFTYGFNFNVNYKNFDLSASFMGQEGNKILNKKRGEMLWTTDGNLDADLAVNRWHGEGTSDKYVSSKGLRKGWNQKMSNYFVEDGSFFRVQNIQLGYNINKKSLFGANMPDTRITLTADRPVTVTNYNGFNPEVANGIDNQTYPIPATYTVGLKVKF